MEGIGVNTLLWKDYRQNVRMLIAVGVFVLMPYLIGLAIVLVAAVRSHLGSDDGAGRDLLYEFMGPNQTWVDVIGGASVFSLCVAALAASFIGGNAFAGERADRTAEFLAYLPIRRGPALVSKAILAVGVCTGMIIANIVIGRICGLPMRDNPSFTNFLVTLATSALLMFGASWLCSTFLQTPAISAACGVFAPFLIAGTLLLWDYLHGSDNAITTERWYSSIATVVGGGLFITGTLYYLRRVDP